MVRADNRIVLISLAAVIAVLLIFGGTGSRPNVKEVSVAEAKALVDSGALVVDVRERSASSASCRAGR